MPRFATLLCSVVLLFSHGIAAAQVAWQPTKPIRLIVPYTTGGAADVLVRIIAEPLRQALGQPIVIDNKGGAGGIIGTDAGAKALADGYTWTIGADPAFTINPHLGAVPYAPLTSFVPVSLVARQPLVLVVNNSLPFASIAELVKLAKSNPGKYTIASSGSGSSGHLAAELLKSAATIDLVHVPFKGQAAALTDVVGGQVDMTFSAIGSANAYIAAGRLRAIATTGPHRFEGLAEVPTFAEAGHPLVEMRAWLGILVPAGTPRQVVARVSAAVTDVLARPEVRQRLVLLGYEPVGGEPSLVTQTIEKDSRVFGKLIRERNIRSE